MAEQSPLPQPVLLDQVDARAWSHMEFISDVHLQRSEEATFQAWSHYMQSVQADALFILGDLFEVWVGDDLLNHPQGAFERECLHIISNTAQRLPVFWLVGNRDFLFNQRALHDSGMKAMNDPCVVQTAQQNWLLSHGDELCVDDVDYQLFRSTVRSADWQQHFLNKPLAERMQLARGLRAQSETRKAMQHMLVDIDEATATDWLNQHHCEVLIHGHTHQPACHPLPQDRQRWVLSDWDACAQPPRLRSLQWNASTGFQFSA